MTLGGALLFLLVASGVAAQTVRPPVAAEPTQPVAAPLPAAAPPMLAPGAVRPPLPAPVQPVAAAPSGSPQTPQEREALRPKVDVLLPRTIAAGPVDAEAGVRGNRRRPICIPAADGLATGIRLRFHPSQRGRALTLAGTEGLEFAASGSNEFAKQRELTVPGNGELLLLLRLDAQKQGRLVVLTGALRTVIPVVGLPPVRFSEAGETPEAGQ